MTRDTDTSPAGRKMSQSCRPDSLQVDDSKRGLYSSCIWCDRELPVRKSPRRREYCSNACRQASYRQSKRYDFRERNAAMMKGVSLLVDAMMGFAG